MVKLNEALVLARSRATDLENVRKFNCWGSDLTDVRIIRHMPNVQVLSLSVNKISTLADFAYCKNLEELYIRKNEIQDLNEIYYLKSLPQLRILWLSDNACSTNDNYRMTVLKHLPNLQKLDNLVVQEDEVNAAIEAGDDLQHPQAPSESLNIRPARSPNPVTSEPNIVSVSMPAFSVIRNITENGTSGNAEQNSETAGNTEQNSETSSNTEQNSESRREDSKNAEGATAAEAIEKVENPETTSQEATIELNPETLSWEETNKIRVQLGLKALSVEKVTPMKPRTTSHSAKSRNINLLQATLHLIKELDGESLEIVSAAIKNRLDSM